MTVAAVLPNLPPLLLLLQALQRYTCQGVLAA
jgi:hypothetical protein